MISITLLVLAVVGSFVISSSLNEIVKSFEGKCPLDAKILFETESEKAFAETGMTVEVGETETQSNLDEELVSASPELASLSTVFNDSYVAFLQQSDEPIKYPFDQVQFLSKCE